MRRIFILFGVLIAFGCTEIQEATLQKRAEAFAEKHTKNMLYVPDSYEPIETRIDSAYLSVYNDVEIFSAAHEILKDNYENLFSMRRSEKECENLQSCVNTIKSRADEISEEFCGWQIYHRCRVKNRMGTPDFVTLLFYTDKNLSDIVICYDLTDDQDYNYDSYKEVIDGVISGEYDTRYQNTRDPYEIMSDYLLEEIPTHSATNTKINITTIKEETQGIDLSDLDISPIEIEESNTKDTSTESTYYETNTDVDTYSNVSLEEYSDLNMI
jgi:hypothetical protein